MRKTVYGLAGLLLGLLALAQSTGGSGGLGGFFSEVLSYVGQAFSGLPNTTSTDLAIQDACAQAGLPTSLRVTSVGTTTSPFCPGLATALARAGGDWTVSIQGGTGDGTLATKTDAVQSGGTTQFEVKYTYNPPPPPEPRGPDGVIYEFDPNTGRWYVKEEYYGPDPFGYWANNYDAQTTLVCIPSQNIPCP